MAPPGIRLWTLSSGGAGSLGLSCTENGLFLGGTALVERRVQGYAVRRPADLERLLGRAYGARVSLDRLMPGFRVVAAALGERNLYLAQIAAVRLRMPDLPDDIARRGLETEDRLIKGERDDRLARGGWDPAEHPRAGVPPNPGWFAPADGGQAPTQTAQGEEDERAPEEMLDPAATLRQAQWDAAIATLRQIDPQNPNLSYIANPGAPPSQAALDRLNGAIEAAAIKRVTDKLMPGGSPIRVAGNNPRIRILPGGVKAARDLFDYLSVGANVEVRNPQVTVAKLPGMAGFVMLCPQSTSGPPAVDVNVPGIPFRGFIFREPIENETERAYR